MAGKNKNFFIGGLLLCTILCVYVVRMYILSPSLFTFQFSPTRIEQYLKSQDISHHVRGRVYLSDEDIHIAAGYLYAVGFDPTAFNFQHPPFIKYLYGYSILFLNNPFFIQLGFGMMLLILTYIASFAITKKHWVAYLASIFLLVDPVFTDLSQHALLDLGQAVFSFLYILVQLYMPGAFIVQGVVLGILAASKFWSTALFFIAAVAIYRFLKKTLIVKEFSLHLVVGFVTFCAIYINSFINRAPFNIIFFQLKTLKYWFNHSVSSVPGDAVLLFTTGQFHMWWMNNTITRAAEWPIMWPIMCAVLLIAVYVFRKKVTPMLFFSLVPLLFLLFISMQAPYMRYFVLILPYCYIMLFHMISLIIKKNKHSIS